MIQHVDSQDAEDQPLLSPVQFVGYEHGGGVGSTASGSTEDRKRLETALVRKLDRRMSILVLMYILNYMDRSNAAAARLRGFEDDLHLEGTQFATVLSVFYIGYISMQIPSNMFLNYFGKPSKYIPLCMTMWGGLSLCTGFARSYFDVLCIRFLLGFAEAAFFPGALFLISKWYTRSELSQRTAFLASGILISNAFGSLLASGILNSMDGVMGFTAWRWLFFVEGAITIIVAIWSMYILPDFPENSSNWLTPSETSLAMERMAEDAGKIDSVISENEKLQGRWPGLYIAVTDWKVWWLTLALLSMITSLSFGVYFPTISATMGYGPTISLILCAPPWLFATAVALAVSKHSDATGERCKHIVSSLSLGIVGFVLAMSTMNTVLRYVSLFFMTQTYAAFICFLAWTSGSVSRTPAKRAVALALINAVSQIGNVIGAYIWPTSWGPTYNTSYSICIFASALCIAMCLAFRLHLALLNSKADALEAEQGARKGYRYML